MSMHATAQRDEQVSPVPIDLNPPVRAESIDLPVLVSHRTATQAGASIEGRRESVQDAHPDAAVRKPQFWRCNNRRGRVRLDSSCFRFKS
jgi:hypothetical protein